MFLAGFVDAVAGGGALIGLPAYFLAGLPAHLALGTNKTASSVGTVVSSIKYFKSGNVRAAIALPAAAGSFVGAAAGARLALLLPEQTVKLMLLAVLPCVALFLSFNRGFGMKKTEIALPVGRQIPLSALIGVVLGGYGGLVGAGTGTFFILAFTAVLGTDLLTGAGCTRVANLASNLASMAVFAAAGKVDWSLAVPAAVLCGAGQYVGSVYALRGGSKNVRKVIFLVLGLLFVKVGLELMGVEL